MIKKKAQRLTPMCYVCRKKFSSQKSLHKLNGRKICSPCFDEAKRKAMERLRVALDNYQPARGNGATANHGEASAMSPTAESAMSSTAEAMSSTAESTRGDAASLLEGLKVAVEAARKLGLDTDPLYTEARSVLEKKALEKLRDALDNYQTALAKGATANHGEASAMSPTAESAMLSTAESTRASLLEDLKVAVETARKLGLDIQKLYAEARSVLEKEALEKLRRALHNYRTATANGATANHSEASVMSPTPESAMSSTAESTRIDAASLLEDLKVAVEAARKLGMETDPLYTEARSVLEKQQPKKAKDAGSKSTPSQKPSQHSEKGAPVPASLGVAYLVYNKGILSLRKTNMGAVELAAKMNKLEGQLKSAFAKAPTDDEWYLIIETKLATLADIKLSDEDMKNAECLTYKIWDLGGQKVTRAMHPKCLIRHSHLHTTFLAFTLTFTFTKLDFNDPFLTRNTNCTRCLRGCTASTPLRTRYAHSWSCSAYPGY